MTEKVIELLKQCKVVHIPSDIYTKDNIIIPKLNEIAIIQGNCYEIKINGRIYAVEVVDANDTSIKVQSPLIDGWIDKSKIEILRKI